MKFKMNKKATKSTEPRKPLLSDKTKKRLKVSFWVIIALAILSLIFWSFVGVTNFYKKYDFSFRSPITIQTPVVVVDRKQQIEKEIDERLKRIAPQAEAHTASPSATPIPAYRFINMNKVPGSYKGGNQEQMAVINSQKHAGIIWRVYALESTYGRNDGCKAKGMVNGFGYGQDGNNNHRCYAKFEYVVADVNEWFETKLEKYTLPEALCGYNQGFNGEGFKKCLQKDAGYPYLTNFFLI